MFVKQKATHPSVACRTFASRFLISNIRRRILSRSHVVNNKSKAQIHKKKEKVAKYLKGKEGQCSSLLRNEILMSSGCGWVGEVTTRVLSH